MPAGPNIPKDNAPPHKQYSPAPRHEFASPTPQMADNHESEIPHPNSTSLLPVSQFPPPSSHPARPPPPASPNRRASRQRPPPPNAVDGNTAAKPPRSHPLPSKPQSARRPSAQQKAATHLSLHTLCPTASCRTPPAPYPTDPETYPQAPQHVPHPSPPGSSRPPSHARRNPAVLHAPPSSPPTHAPAPREQTASLPPPQLH